MTVTPASVSFAPNASLAIAINGTTAGSQYNQLSVGGDVDLTGANLLLRGTWQPVPGQVFMIVNNTGTDPIMGTFNGLPQGAVLPNILGSSLNAAISYVGGNGNDVTLTVGNPVATQTTVTASASTATYGQSITFTATVTANGAAPTGSVQFVDASRGVNLGAGVLQSSNGGTSVWTYVTSPGQSQVTGGAAVTRAVYTPTALFFGSSGTLPGGETTLPATLTLIAMTNTKAYDGTTSAAATPTVSGLLGSDTVTNLTEAYTSANAGTSKTLSVNTYTVNDGNGGNDYAVTEVSSSTGVITPGPFVQFVDTIIGGNTVVAGSPFFFMVQAADQAGNPVSNYTGPLTVRTVSNGQDPQGNFPISGALLSPGTATGFFLGDFKTAGTYTLTTTAGTVAGTSPTITVVPAAATSFVVTAPSAALTGSSFSVTATAYDPYGNVATGYSGTVRLTSSDASAALGDAYTFKTGPGQDNGVHTFNVTLMAAGNQTITTTDTVSLNPLITGRSNTITTRGLVVTSCTPLADGFRATFNKPFVTADVALYGSTGTSVADVLMTGAGIGAIHGTLLIDATDGTMTFKATASYLGLLNSLHSGNDSVAMPDATYTVTLISGSGTHGFLDLLDGGLDGANNGGHANFITTFTTHYQANATPVLGIPDFARGPASNMPIVVPNNGAAGIPITLYNAAHVTDVTFTLTYNPSLLTVTGALSGAASDAGDPAAVLTLVSNSGGVATFHYTDVNSLSATSSSPLVLGDVEAVVPSGVEAAALGLYQAKEQVQLGGMVIDQGGITGAVAANGIHVNAYFGDVNGDKVIDGLDKLTANTVATGASTGFSGYAQLDPAIIGDVAGDFSVDAGDVSTIDAFVAQLQPTQIPEPPTQVAASNPSYVNPNSIHSPNAADPTLSVVTSRPTPADSPSGVDIAVIIDHPHPDGSTGLTEATLALTYDPSMLNVAAADITLGTVPGRGTGWQIISMVDKTTGQIGIQLYSATPIIATQGGSLVNITFHMLPGATASTTAVQLVNAATPYGQWFGTVLADSQGGLILSPGVDQVLVPAGSGNASAVTSANSESTDATRPASQLVLVGALAQDDPQETSGISLMASSEDGKPDIFLRNGMLGGQTSSIVSASVVPSGSLVLARGTNELEDHGLYFDNMMWNTIHESDWSTGPSSTVGTDTYPTTVPPDQKASDQKHISHIDALNMAFADWANDAGEFGDH